MIPTDAHRYLLLICVHLCSSVAPLFAADWPMFRFNPARTGAADAVAGPERPAVLWTYRDEKIRLAEFTSSPAVADGRLYIGCENRNVFARDGAVMCLDAATGRLIWHVKTAQPVFSSPAVANGRVYVGEGLHENRDSVFRCLDAQTGKPLWQFTVASHAESSPAVADGRVYFGAGEDGIYCLDAATGKKIWHVPGHHIDDAPVVVAGRVYVGVGYENPRLLVLDAATGKLVWEKPTPASVWGSAAIADGRVCFGISSATIGGEDTRRIGKVYCVSAADGKELWTFAPDHGIGGSLVVDKADVFASPAVDERHLHIGTDEGRILALRRDTGKVQWSVTLKRWLPEGTRILSSPALVNGRLYVGTGSNLVLCIGKP